MENLFLIFGFLASIFLDLSLCKLAFSGGDQTQFVILYILAASMWTSFVILEDKNGMILSFFKGIFVFPVFTPIVIALGIIISFISGFFRKPEKRLKRKRKTIDGSYFFTGDRVSFFVDKQVSISGKLVKINRKTMKIESDLGTIWQVPHAEVTKIRPIKKIPKVKINSPGPQLHLIQ
jgi:hypothetical protein